jgi:hypothetical protein
MTQSWSLFEFALLTAFAGCACGRTHNLEFQTRSPEPVTLRHAPGVAVDPAHELPAATRSATHQNGLVVLQAPGNVQPDRALVESFFDAVTERDSGKLERLLAPNAKTKSSARATEIDALDFWKARLTRLDYGKLVGQGIYRRYSIEVYRPEDLAVLGSDRNVPVNVGEGEVAVRVPLYTSEVDKTRLFGSEIVFLLTPTSDGLRIVEIVEDFQLP